jgi:hypothetical protein
MNMGFKKKLHIPFPIKETQRIETQRTQNSRRVEKCDARSIESQVRQLLCDKISGNLTGIWLLIPEHLRLGTWDVLLQWTGKETGGIEPRAALQLVHEAALCITGKRRRRTLSQQGFEVANGLPFVVSDWEIHDLLDSHTITDAITAQTMLGKLRTALGHYAGKVIAIDPHRITSYSKRQMVRHKDDRHGKARKQIQTFFALDADTQQPICFTVGSSSRTVTRATPELLHIASEILHLSGSKVLVLADTEHYSVRLLENVRDKMPFDLLVPMPRRKEFVKAWRAIPEDAFKKHWIGYATAKLPYRPQGCKGDTLWQTVQRCREMEKEYEMRGFICTSENASVEEPVQQYPKRWHCEEFFNANQSLGWNRAGTLNLNIRYGHMTMALVAQASISMLRKRLGEPLASWDSRHLARDFFQGLEGDVRINQDRIIVTYYNAPNMELLQQHYSHLPERLEKEGVDAKIPWLYNYKIDFRFK